MAELAQRKQELMYELASYSNMRAQQASKEAPVRGGEELLPRVCKQAVGVEGDEWTAESTDWVVGG